jgi:hypothetical protein
MLKIFLIAATAALLSATSVQVAYAWSEANCIAACRQAPGVRGVDHCIKVQHACAQYRGQKSESAGYVRKFTNDFKAGKVDSHGRSR